MSTTRLLWIHTLSPLHVGTGQSVGAVDLAIARDRATDHPYIPGSSIKGSLADLAGKRDPGSWAKEAFGPDTARASEHAGSLAFGDAHLLLLPVRSTSGTFAWATSPLLLGRYARDAREVGITAPEVPTVGNIDKCLVSTTSALAVSSASNKVVFEDLDFTPDGNKAPADAWADHLGKHLFGEDLTWRRMLKARLCVLHDDVMTYLTRHGTDVRMRVALDYETKTAKKGQLWTEETLPVETVLVSLVAQRPNAGSRGANAGTDVFVKLGETFGHSVQIGGNATVGHGRCALRLDGGGK